MRSTPELIVTLPIGLRECALTVGERGAVVAADGDGCGAQVYGAVDLEGVGAGAVVVDREQAEAGRN